MVKFNTCNRKFLVKQASGGFFILVRRFARVRLVRALLGGGQILHPPPCLTSEGRKKTGKTEIDKLSTRRTLGAYLFFA